MECTATNWMKISGLFIRKFALVLKVRVSLITTFVNGILLSDNRTLSYFLKKLLRLHLGVTSLVTEIATTSSIVF